MTANGENATSDPKRERAETSEEGGDEPPTKVQKVAEDSDQKANGKENTENAESEKTATDPNNSGAAAEVSSEGKPPEESKGDENAPPSENPPSENAASNVADEKQTESQAPAAAAGAVAAAVEGGKESVPPTATPPVAPSAPQVAQTSAPVTAKVPNGLPPGIPAGQAAPVDPNAAANVTNPASIVEERGEVSALYVGRVIGKGGEMIRDLQARSGCRIDVDQNVPTGQPRVITYRGSRKTVDFAKRLVQMLCSENASEADLPLGEAKREFLVVPAQSVGKIIGRGGEMIRELQSRSQAKIQVDHSGTSGLDHTEKQVTITGTEQSVTKAKEMVLFLVANPMMDAMQAINMLVEDKVHRGGVWGSGPPYTNLPNQGHNMQPNTGGGYGYDQPSYYGGASAPGAAAPGYGAPPASAYGAPNAPYAPAVPAYQQQQQANASYGQYGASTGVEMEIFYAAKNYMGRIIGQKGVTINDLQRRSACDIQINQDVPPGQDCEISIRGSRPGIEKVKQMLREIIEIGPNHPYAGGTQPSGGGYQQGGYGQMQQQPYGGYPQQQQQPQAQQQPAYGQGYDQQQYQAAQYGRTMGYQAPQPAPYGQPAMAYQAPPTYGQPAAAPAAAAGGGWKSATSPDGQIYYYNKRTGETQWEKPIGMP